MRRPANFDAMHHCGACLSSACADARMQCRRSDAEHASVTGSGTVANVLLQRGHRRRDPERFPNVDHRIPAGGYETTARVVNLYIQAINGRADILLRFNGLLLLGEATCKLYRRPRLQCRRLLDRRSCLHGRNRCRACGLARRWHEAAAIRSGVTSEIPLEGNPPNGQEPGAN